MSKIHEVVIVGAGFGGLGMAIALKKQGVDDIVILEKAADVGGVWRDNTYPGAACDVPSHLYSFSFEPNPNWSHVFARQPEIYAYLRHCADKYDLRRHLRCEVEVAAMRFDDASSIWHITLASGEVLQARMVVNATGQLSRPIYPKLKGIEAFKGESFHSAHWRHDLDLSGKRVAVIGTGASAIQFVPAIAPSVAKLSVFQRSPAYMMARPDRPYSGVEKWVFKRAPKTMSLYRGGIYLKYESRALAFTRMKSLLKVAVGLPFKSLLKKQVPDLLLREKLTPDYAIGCKRILLSSDYLATMSRDNVNLVTTAVSQITATGVETSDGNVHPADVLIYGTGFAATDFLAPMKVSGRAGLDLKDVWQQGAKAYLGMSVPGFPNFFMLYGPNTNLGHNSIVYMLESQIAHIMTCRARLVQENGRCIEVNEGRYENFTSAVQVRLANSVWAGCRSWYIDDNGHNSASWPGFTLSYRWLTRNPPRDAYRVS